MRHLDLFSGYLGFSESIGSVYGDEYELVAACEIERNCQHVIRRHRPSVPIFSDVMEFDGRPYRNTIDVVSFGSPCQDLSVAGRRSGLDGERSGLFFEAVRIIEEVRPEWFVFENVPGLLSSNGGADMGTVLGEFSKLGYWWAYRSLDLQYFGCPQRRERVFAVGHIGERSYPAKVLFEPESLCRNIAKGAKTGKEVAGSLGCCTQGGWGQDLDRSGAFISEVDCIKGAAIGRKPEAGPQYSEILRNTSFTLNATEVHAVAHTLRAEYDASEDGMGRGTPIVPEVVGTLSCNTGPSGHDAGNFQCNQAVDSGHVIPVAFAQNQRGELRTSDVAPQLTCGGGKPGEGYAAVAVRTAQTGANGIGISYGASHTLDGTGGEALIQGMQVRRLTPLECTRLMGLPDGWVEWGIDEKGNRVELSDSAQYRMLGNGVAIPVVKWIAQRMRSVPCSPA